MNLGLLLPVVGIFFSLLYYYHRSSKRLLTIDELVGLKHLSVREKRSSFPVLIIDDKPFPCESSLIKHGFKITQLTDITDIKQIEPYEIVLFDIQDVGKSLDPQFQGAHLIREARAHYPVKFLFRFSGYQYSGEYDKFFKLSDGNVPKDIGPDALIEIIDRCIDELANPKQQWFRIRNFLLGLGVTTYEVAVKESEYVNAINHKREPNFSQVKKLGTTEESREIVESVISRAVKEFIKISLS